MTVMCATVKLYIPWANSLKDKRSVVKGLLVKLHDKFNISAAEVEDHDIHRSVVIALACVGADTSYAAGVIDRAVEFIDSACEAQITDVFKEVR